MSFEIHYDDRVIVETARGIEYGQVVIAPMEFPDERVPQPLKPILRMATADDRERAAENHRKEREAYWICKSKIAERELDSATRYVPPMINQLGKPYPEKIAVIGAGPAGLSCAYYLAAKGYPVTVFEKEQVLGGMLTLGIPSFRLEKDVIKAEIDVLRELGVEFKTGVEVGKDVSLDALRDLGFKAFYLAVGASKGAKLSLPGEELPGVV